ncbi:helicase-associated domain-containing protein [Cellulomonas sp. C5510]|uniref:helicase-associated domain-containing protein n=1 Tax=Cellulomonas sp. C5510 TaxID=2871170 RepID=UPI001C95B2B5|nr:helicase-associated domain-containing protein [Cellulomonas sp. C5510]QZN86118.1 helicase-associated domain-containing protein [Cellulomonas sp. C5510]
MATFSEHLRGRSDDDLVRLLLRRPDLAHPSPATLASLAARATSRPSLERALAGVDAAVLQAVESVVVLLDRADPGAGVRARDVVAAVGGDRATAPSVREALRDATDLALLHPVGGRTADPLLRPAPGVAELLGPGAAGRAAARGDDPDEAAVREALASAPAAGRTVLDALVWGPPVGVRPSAGPAADAVAELLRLGLLVRADDRHVLLPRSVALVLRDGRTHRAPATPPGDADLPHRDAALVEAEHAAAAERVVRLVAGLVRLWEQAPPPVLRAGGLGVRDLRRTAAALEVTEPEAAFVVELAGAGGLVRDDGEESPHWVPTTAADEWLARDLPGRWARLAAWWAATTRTPALVGTRDDRGGVRAALGPDGARPWAPRLRRQVLDVLEDAAPGAAPGPEQVRAVLAWRTPRAQPPTDAVGAVLREAGWLGVLGAGALPAAGRALRDEDPLPGLARGLDAALPPAVDDLLLQADLTGIVPGRPSAALEALVDACARVESRGGAVTVRFTPESVRSALDAGRSADDLLGALATHARGRVPQPLEYLVRDAARRHGRLRAGAASSYVRAEDPALLAGLAEDPRHAALGLVRLAPTVLAAQAPVHELLAALRAHGLAPVAETPDGQVLHAAPTVRRVTAGRTRADEPARGGVPQAERAAALVGLLRRAGSEPRAAARPGTTPGAGPAASATAGTGAGGPGRAGGTADVAEALGLLREAAAGHTEVWLDVVGSRGALERRRVRPVRVDGGRVRVVDTTRDAEIVVAAHRVAAVTPVAVPDVDDHAPDPWRTDTA